MSDKFPGFEFSNNFVGGPDSSWLGNSKHIYNPVEYSGRPLILLFISPIFLQLFIFVLCPDENNIIKVKNKAFII